MAAAAPPDIAIAVPRMPDADALTPYLRCIEEAHSYSNFGPPVHEFEARAAANFGIEPTSLTTLSSGARRTGGRTGRLNGIGVFSSAIGNLAGQA